MQKLRLVPETLSQNGAGKKHFFPHDMEYGAPFCDCDATSKSLDVFSVDPPIRGEIGVLLWGVPDLLASYCFGPRYSGLRFFGIFLPSIDQFLADFRGQFRTLIAVMLSFFKQPIEELSPPWKDWGLIPYRVSDLLNFYDFFFTNRLPRQHVCVWPFFIRNGNASNPTSRFPFGCSEAQLVQQVAVSRSCKRELNWEIFMSQNQCS